jgi:predicted RNase H-like nuclease (RuvC/YqgF family)
MPPPARRSAADEISIGELARLIESQTRVIEEMRAELKSLSQTYDTKERVDLLVGGIKVDIRRLEEEVAEAKKRTEATDDEINRRYRASVTLTISALLAPLTIALVVFLLTRTSA